MRDAIGGTVNIFLIAVFMTVVSGYMAFNISYVKAFKVKNKIIDLIEQYEGDCRPNDSSNTCTKKVSEYMTQIGYNTEINGSLFCSTDQNSHQSTCWCNNADGYCISKKTADKPTATNSYSPEQDMAERAYYTVVTQVNIDIPIIKNVLPNLKIFTVTGDTKVIRVKPR